MGRAPRIEYAGAIYHVMNRGNHLGPIFKDDRDRVIFMRTLKEVCQSAGWVVHGYVLMSNHYHLLIETQRATLVKGMQWLNSTYTKRYNVKNETYGHLFQGRYKALLVDGDEEGYFLTVSDYIHMNPVRIGMVKTLEELLEDPWSSAGWLAGQGKGRPVWLRWERVYGELGMKRWGEREQREYVKYLQERVVSARKEGERWKSVRRGWCFGGDGFQKKMSKRLEKMMGEGVRQGDSWSGEAVDEMEEKLANRRLEYGAKSLGYGELEQVRGVDRDLLACWVRQWSKVGVKWLAQRLGMGTTNGMSSAIWRLGKKMEASRSLKEKWRKLEICLEKMD